MLPSRVRAVAANSAFCDLLLVDGGHSNATKRLNLQMLRRVARPSSRIVVDDIINVNQSAALHRMESQRAIRILEAYSFQKNSKHNPCPLNPKRRILPCDTRGFAVVEYAVRRAT